MSLMVMRVNERLPSDPDLGGRSEFLLREMPGAELKLEFKKDYILLIKFAKVIGGLLWRKSDPGVQNLPPPAGMQLIEGYRHRCVPTLDTTRGVVWKDGGPRIDYDIDMYGPNQARGYFQSAKTIRRTTMKVHGVPTDVVFDAEANTLVVTIGSYSNFTATAVKSDRDLTEVLLMLMSYDMSKGR